MTSITDNLTNPSLQQIEMVKIDPFVKVACPEIINYFPYIK